MKRFKDGFHVVVRDNDTKQFYVSSKIFNDTYYIDRVTIAKQQGRDVMCSSDEASRDTIILNYKIQYPDFNYTVDHLV